MGSVSYGALLDGGAGDDGTGFCYFVTIISQNVLIIIIIIIDNIRMMIKYYHQE